MKKKLKEKTQEQRYEILKLKAFYKIMMREKDAEIVSLNSELNKMEDLLKVCLNTIYPDEKE